MLEFTVFIRVKIDNLKDLSISMPEIVRKEDKMSNDNININMEEAFKLGILTLMNTVNSSMFGLNDFNYLNLNISSKLILITFMIIGRVELLTILIICKKFLFKN